MIEPPPDPTFADILNGFTLGRGRRGNPPDPPPVPPPEPVADRTAPPPEPPPPPPREEFRDETAMVRPYAWTRGRTRSNADLKLETLVSASPLGQHENVLARVEFRTVSQLCRHPHSVAEVAAKLSIPLGVARVILGDMAELGLIIVHQSVADDDAAAHLVLMERVLSGLRRL